MAQRYPNMDKTNYHLFINLMLNFTFQDGLLNTRVFCSQYYLAYSQIYLNLTPLLPL